MRGQMGGVFNQKLVNPLIYTSSLVPLYRRLVSDVHIDKSKVRVQMEILD